MLAYIDISVLYHPAQLLCIHFTHAYRESFFFIMYTVFVFYIPYFYLFVFYVLEGGIYLYTHLSSARLAGNEEEGKKKKKKRKKIYIFQIKMKINFYSLFLFYA